MPVSSFIMRESARSMHRILLTTGRFENNDIHRYRMRIGSAFETKIAGRFR
jgi:hypothetical protein